jgi:branched-chain amino acid transport system ATP-binding protein
MEPPCLVLEHLTRAFGGLTAVDDVNLTIQAGERHALIGPNGAGKTTLFNLISGELRATAGRILFFGADVTGMAPYRRAVRGIARTFQITRLFLDLTVLDNVLLACQALDRRKFTMYRPLSSYEDLMHKAADVLGEFGLSHLRQARARTLSYGDQRKLEVALSMAGRPRLLLLDEPMAGLSSGETKAMLGLLQKLDPAIAVLLIEHDIDIAFGFADKVTVLYQGKVLTEGHRDEVRGNRKVQEIYLGTGSGLQASDFRPGAGSQRPEA